MHLFPCPCLRRIVYHNETAARIEEMQQAGFSDREITSYLLERKRDLPHQDGEMAAEERADLERRSWCWRRERSWDGTEGWKLDTRFLLTFEFLPHACFVAFLEKVDLEDPDFRERHLDLSREVAKVLGVDEFLIVFDSATKSSEVYGGFPQEDFAFHKKWLLENLGPPKKALEAMSVELEDCYDFEGYYWERVPHLGEGSAKS